MMSMLRFRTREGTFLAPIEKVTGVGLATEIKPLPGRKARVAGFVEREGRAVTVLSTLGESGTHIVLFSSTGEHFGLLAEEVTGVVSVSEVDVEPAPSGQERGFVKGIVKTRTGLELMLSVDALRSELAPVKQA